MFGGASTMYQRTVVEAHGRKWLVCLALEDTTEEHDALADRFAMATPCDDAGMVQLPGELQLIRFTPEHVAKMRVVRADCIAAGHPLGEEKRVSYENMGACCNCGAEKTRRPLTAEERAALSRPAPLGGTYLRNGEP